VRAAGWSVAVIDTGRSAMARCALRPQKVVSGAEAIDFGHRMRGTRLRGTGYDWPDLIASSEFTILVPANTNECTPEGY